MRRFEEGGCQPAVIFLCHRTLVPERQFARRESLAELFFQVVGQCFVGVVGGEENADWAGHSEREGTEEDALAGQEMVKSPVPAASYLRGLLWYPLSSYGCNSSRYICSSSFSSLFTSR